MDAAVLPGAERLRIVPGSGVAQPSVGGLLRLQSTGLFLGPALYSPVHDLIPRRHSPPGITL